MGDNFSIEVAGVLSDIIFETNVEDSFYYIKDKSYIPMSIRCRLLKVKRNKQPLYLVYFYISVNETVFEACCLSLDKQHLILALRQICRGDDRTRASRIQQEMVN